MARGHDDMSRMLAMQWEDPPEQLQVLVGRMPDFEPAPSLSPTGSCERSFPEDVRGASLLATASSQLQVHTFSCADISVHMQPSHRGRSCRIEGRIWLHEPKDDPIAVVLVQGDHVLATTEMYDGGHFVLDEPVGCGWALEFHVPGHDSLVVEGGLR